MLTACWASIVDHCFDGYYGLDTCAKCDLDSVTIANGSRERGNGYQAARVLLLRRLCQLLRSLCPQDGVFVDIGCGKGRALLIAMECGFKKVTGVEFAKELCISANNNIAIYKAKTNLISRCVVIEADATTYTIAPDENVFFFFNPFDDVLMAKTIENIIASVRFHPRQIYIAYLTPKHHVVLDTRTEIALIQDSRIWGSRVRVYTNRP